MILIIFKSILIKLINFDKVYKKWYKSVLYIIFLNQVVIVTATLWLLGGVILI